jgi:hypothetical protein
MDWRHAPEILTAGAKVFTELKNVVVWAKTNAGQRTFYRSQHELVFAFKYGTAPHSNNFELGQHGRFLLTRKSRSDRMRAKLKGIKKELRLRMHQPIAVQGK